MGEHVQVEFKIKRIELFERTLPEARWSCCQYQPKLATPKRKWVLKSPQEPAKL